MAEGLAREIDLLSGRLVVRVNRADCDLEEICGFASRKNQRRGFLFVSRVLGKHIPVRPSVVRHFHKMLATKLSSELPGPIVFVGMAETAIALGQGVYREFQLNTGRMDLLFTHTTRFVLEGPRIQFREEHSHAPFQYLYHPRSKILSTAKTLVLIDDEQTTGNTFVNAANAICSAYQSIERIVLVVLTDWRSAASQRSVQIGLARPVQTVSLIEGDYSFEPHSHAPVYESSFLEPVSQAQVGLDFGRLGLRGVMDISLPAVPVIRKGERVLVLGTGEFMFPPFLLAEQLENRGCETYFQSTSRSPVALGHDIVSVTEVDDIYREGAPIYLYNFDREKYDRVLLCVETSTEYISREMLQKLEAEMVAFS